MREIRDGQLSMKEEKEEQDSQGTLSTRADGRRLQWVPSVKKGARGGGAGPAPSPGGRGREKTLRGGSAGASGSCQATEVQAALAAPLRTRRQREL